MEASACVWCGCPAPADAGSAAVAGWVTQHDRDRATMLCPDCARRHVRDIEAKLDEEFWAG